MRPGAEFAELTAPAQAEVSYIGGEREKEREMSVEGG